MRPGFILRVTLEDLVDNEVSFMRKRLVRKKVPEVICIYLVREQHSY